MVLEFLEAMQANDPEPIFEYYDKGIIQTEFPNHIMPSTARRNLEDLKTAWQKGKRIMQSERYEVTHSYAFGDIVIIEAKWIGKLSVDIGTLKAGEEIKAFFAQIFEFQNGKIVRQRNYDCFEPFLM